MSNDGHCPPELAGNFYLGKHVDKIEHERMCICARIEISQNADNTDRKVKWFLKVSKTYKIFVGRIFLIIIFLKFLFTFTFYKLF